MKSHSLKLPEGIALWSRYLAFEVLHKTKYPTFLLLGEC